MQAGLVRAFGLSGSAGRDSGLANKTDEIDRIDLSPSPVPCPSRVGGRRTVGVRSFQRQGETHEIASLIRIGMETQMRARRRQARLATKEEKTTQQGQSEKNPDNIFQRDTFRMVKNARSRASPPRLGVHGKKRLPLHILSPGRGNIARVPKLLNALRATHFMSCRSTS